MTNVFALAFLTGTQNKRGHKLHHSVYRGFNLLDSQDNVQIPNELIVEGFFAILSSSFGTLFLNLAEHDGVLAVVCGRLLALLKDVWNDGAKGVEDR